MQHVNPTVLSRIFKGKLLIYAQRLPWYYNLFYIYPLHNAS
jgi:hypothetical protein